MHHKTDYFQWAIWKISESENELLSHLPHSTEYLQQLNHFTAPSRRLEWIAVRVLLYHILHEKKEITYLQNGKPYLSDHSYHISISHTKGYAAIILSEDKDVGIDIEQYGRKVEKVAAHYIRKDEVPTSYNNDTIWSLLLHWSAKETIYKCLNISDVDFIQHIRIYPFNVRPEGTFKAQEYKTSLKHCYNVRYLLQRNFVLTYLFIN